MQTTTALVTLDTPGLPGLVTDDAITRALSRATCLEELNALDGELKAFETYAKAQRATLPELNRIKAARLRAQRKAGGCLLAIERLEGGRPTKGNVRQPESNFAAALREAGISEGSAYRWQSYALVPEPVFEGWLDATAQEGNEITATNLLLLAKQYIGRPQRMPTAKLVAPAESLHKREKAVEAKRQIVRAFELPSDNGHVVNLMFPDYERKQFEEQVQFLRVTFGTANVSETVRACVRRQYDGIVKGRTAEDGGREQRPGGLSAASDPGSMPNGSRAQIGGPSAGEAEVRRLNA